MKLTNAQNANLGTSPSQTLTSGLYQAVDFTGLNPADPAIDGFVTDVNGQGVSGATVNLYNVAQKLMQSAVTSSSGHYSFRFSNPGTFTPTGPVASRLAPGSSRVRFSHGRRSEVRRVVDGQPEEQRPSPLLVIVPRDQGGSCASLAAEFEVVPGCRVMIDRRLAERRRVERACAAEERRGGDRRSGRLESSQGLVVLVH